ncbi:MAG: hypothetical protein ACK46S_08685 [Bacteroidota bacterium]
MPKFQEKLKKRRKNNQCKLAAQVQNNFVPELKIKQMENDNMLKVTFDYVFSKLEDNMIDWILNNDLKKEEKIEILSSLSEYRLKQILFNAGLKPEYLETI